jgi:hypothetical protein
MNSRQRWSTDLRDELRRALRLNGFDQEGVERVGAFGGTQFVDQSAISQQTRDSGQGLEMVGTSAFGCNQQKSNIDRPLSDGIEIDRRRHSREETARAADPSHTTMRDSDAAANAGRPQTLALDQEIEQTPFIDAVETGRAMRQLRQ